MSFKDRVEATRARLETEREQTIHEDRMRKYQEREEAELQMRRKEQRIRDTGGFKEMVVAIENTELHEAIHDYWEALGNVPVGERSQVLRKLPKLIYERPEFRLEKKVEFPCFSGRAKREPDEHFPLARITLRLPYVYREEAIELEEAKDLFFLQAILKEEDEFHFRIANGSDSSPGSWDGPADWDHRYETYGTVDDILELLAEKIVKKQRLISTTVLHPCM